MKEGNDMLPLYKDFTPFKAYNFADWLKRSSASVHPGLLFDKFAKEWAPQWHAPLREGAKNIFFKEFAEIDYTYLENDLKANLERQERLVRHLCRPDKPAMLPVKTDWRFVSGLGSGHPYETGFIWHRTLGVPYLPGSSVKGMIRAWAEQWCRDEPAIQKEAARLFGSGAENEGGSEDRAGDLIVFDALPTRPPKLELDILNPHYQPYYESNGAMPPADYYNPIPVFFLAVAPGQPFRFALAPRPGAASDDPASDLATGVQLLKDALLTIGAGGKTAVGYGQMICEQKINERVRQKAEKWLTTTMKKLRENRDFQGQPEENLWKKALAEKWQFSPSEIKPILREMIQNSWKNLGINWNQPEGKSAQKAKRLFDGS